MDFSVQTAWVNVLWDSEETGQSPLQTQDKNYNSSEFSIF